MAQAVSPSHRHAKLLDYSSVLVLIHSSLSTQLIVLTGYQVTLVVNVDCMFF